MEAQDGLMVAAGDRVIVSVTTREANWHDPISGKDRLSRIFVVHNVEGHPALEYPPEYGFRPVAIQVGAMFYEEELLMLKGGGVDIVGFD